MMLTTILCYVGIEEVCLSKENDCTPVYKDLTLYISLQDYYDNQDKIKDCVFLSEKGVFPATYDVNEHHGCRYETCNKTLQHWYIPQNNGAPSLSIIPNISILSEQTVNICENKLEEEQKKYYVSHCGNKKIGIYLLKGFAGPDNQRNCDFYDYSSNAKTVNMDNLRNFFDGKQITYTEQSQTTKTTVSATQVQQCLYSFLTLYCNPFNTNTKPKCVSECPQDGWTDGTSQYTLQTFKGNTIFRSISNWKIKTIANCGVTDFQDDAGYYFFGNDDKSKALVKYSNTNDPGNRFYY